MNVPGMAASAADMTQAAVKKARIRSIDAMRGLVMLIMLIDHTRERFFLHQYVNDPMDVQQTDPMLFWTRMAAHLCAPTFVFLTGLSAWLYAHPTSGYRSPAGFLAKRGLFLIFLEVVVLTGLWFVLANTIYLQVIWAIGLTMLVLALLCRLPYPVLLALGLLITLGHNALTPIQFEPGEWGYGIWTILHDRGYLWRSEMISFKVSYPLLPWIGVILLGYCAGPLFARSADAQWRQCWLLNMGLGCLGVLLILRGMNLYGETLDWQMQGDWVRTLMDFFNYTKYPPSLDFLLLTLGIMFLTLRVLERCPRLQGSKVEQVLVDFGSAPMFFYLLHLYLLMGLYYLAVAIWGTNQGAFFGVDHIAWVWLITLVMAAVTWWPTRSFSRYKHASTQPWIKYL